MDGVLHLWFKSKLFPENDIRLIIIIIKYYLRDLISGYWWPILPFCPIFVLCLINWTWHFNDVLWILENSPFLMTKKLLLTCKNHLKYTSITHSGCSGPSGIFSGQNGHRGTSEAYFWSEDVPVGHWRWLSCKLWIAAGDEVHRLNRKGLQQRPIWDPLIRNASHVAL